MVRSLHSAEVASNRKLKRKF